MELARPFLVLVLLLLSVGIYVRRQFHSGVDPRISVLEIAVILGALVCFFSEGLSLVHRLDTPGAVFSWSLALLCFLAWSYMGHSARHPHKPEWRGILAGHKAVFALTAAIALILGFIALKAAPNNYDSMTYRLSRVMHWQSAKSLEFYATHILRQIYQPPGAEMCVLQLHLLTGGDRLANLVQYFAMIGSVLGVTHVVKLLDGNTRAQGIAAVSTITIPMGILQSTSTQNDYLVTFWLVCFVNFFLLLRRNWSLRWALFSGAALGLALLTKFTAYFYALPLLLWLVGSSANHLRRAWKPLGLLAVVVLFLNGGMYIRNWRGFGNPLGPGQENPVYKFSNSRLDARSMISGVARSTALHLGAVPSRWWRARITAANRRLHDAIGLDENDPMLTWPETKFGPTFTLHEDNAGNFAHLLFILASLPLLFGRKTPGGAESRIYAACLIAGYVLFCWIVRWSPARTRMHLVFFLLMMPCAALAVDRIQLRLVSTLLMTGLVIQSLPFLLINQTRPLFGSASILHLDRTHQYFMNSSHLLIPYYRAARHLLSHDCRQAGLIVGGDDYEFPLWAMTDYSVQFEHIAVTNYSSRYARPFQPCAIVTTLPNKGPIQSAGRRFVPALRQPPVTVLLPER